MCIDQVIKFTNLTQVKTYRFTKFRQCTKKNYDLYFLR